jgi:nitrate reductase gamma subunit
MHATYALTMVALLALLGFIGGEVSSLRWLVGVIVPWTALLIFLLGVSYRIMVWARSPAPFRIPTTCGQQASLPWIKTGWLESPSSTPGVVLRMALEVLLFRSLFRNTRAELREGPRLVFGEDKFLWLGALAFHWAFLVIFVRHLRFFLEPVPNFVTLLARLDGFFEVGLPAFYLTDGIILAALAYLVLRRVTNPQVRYISLYIDYLLLFLLLGLVLSGMAMRYVVRIDAMAAKQFALGLVTASPVIPPALGSLFFVHLIFLAALAASIPFSKLMHLGGIFLSPTRNLANTNRLRRHVNPWDAPVPVHTYAEWEDEFRDKLEAAGLPVESGGRGAGGGG